MVPGDQPCREPQQLSPLKKPTDALQISLVFTLQVLAFIKASCLSPSLLPTSPPLPQPPGPWDLHRQPSQAVSLSARHQPR